MFAVWVGGSNPASTAYLGCSHMPPRSLPEWPFTPALHHHPPAGNWQQWLGVKKHPTPSLTAPGQAAVALGLGLLRGERPQAPSPTALPASPREAAKERGLSSGSLQQTRPQKILIPKAILLG